MNSARSLLLLPWILLFPFVVSAQTLVFDAYFRDSHVGEMVLKKSAEGNQTILRTVSDLSISMLLTIDIYTEYETVFDGGNLIRSYTKNFRDGDLTEGTQGWRNGAAYHVQRPDERRSVHSPRIEHTVSGLHWNEPRGVSQVYSERWGTFLDMVRYDDGRYGLHQPNGDVNYYRYANNQLQWIEVNYGWLSMEFRRRQ